MAQSESLAAETEKLSRVLSLVEAFRAFDSDSDGDITTPELGGILSSLGYNASEQQVTEMMQQADTNKDGLLSIQEFLEMNTKDMEVGGLANCLNSAFQALGNDGDGAVTAEELYQVIGNNELNLSLEDCQEIVDSMDGDGDGIVDLEDFKLIVTSLL